MKLRGLRAYPALLWLRRFATNKKHEQFVEEQHAIHAKQKQLQFWIKLGYVCGKIQISMALIYWSAKAESLVARLKPYWMAWA